VTPPSQYIDEEKKEEMPTSLQKVDDIQLNELDENFAVINHTS
jgi:hypothetical protein